MYHNHDEMTQCSILLLFKCITKMYDDENWMKNDELEMMCDHYISVGGPKCTICIPCA